MRVTTLTDETKAVRTLTEAAAEKKPFDFAVIDIIMPQLSGFELAALIKNSPPEINSIPLLGIHLLDRKNCRQMPRCRFLRVSHQTGQEIDIVQGP